MHEGMKGKHKGEGSGGGKKMRELDLVEGIGSGGGKKLHLARLRHHSS